LVIETHQNTATWQHELWPVWKVTFQLSLKAFLSKRIKLCLYSLSITKFSQALKEPKLSDLVEIGEMVQRLFLEEERTTGKTDDQFYHIAS